MKKITKKLLQVYKGTLSFLLEILFGKGCRFSPTCSEYMVEAIERRGPIKGLFLGIKRLSRCHPFNAPGFDPVPLK